MAGILCIPAAWLLGRRFGAGLALATLVAFDPALVVLSSLARMYALLALLTLVALWRMDALVGSEARRAEAWLELGAVLLAATWTHYLGYMLAAAVIGTILWRSGASRSLLAAVPVAAGALAPLGRAAGLVLSGRETQWDRLMPKPEQQLTWTRAAGRVIERAADVWPIGEPAALLALAGIAGIFALRRRSPPLALAVAALAALSLLAIFVGAPRRIFGIDRYLVPWRLSMCIGLAALAALAGARRHGARAGVGAGIVALALVGIRAAAPTGRLPAPFAIGDLARSLATRAGPADAAVVEKPYLRAMASWYGLRADALRSDGSAVRSERPAERTWLLIEETSALPRAPGLPYPRTQVPPPPASLWLGLERAYDARVDEDALRRALRSRGAAAIEFTAGAATIQTARP